MLKLTIGLITVVAQTVIIDTLGGNIIVALGAALLLGLGWGSIWNTFFKEN